MGDGMKVGELFAGIGGIGLGLEATGGFEVVWQVEKDDYATKVLEKNWPAVRRWDDVKTFPPETGTWDVDLITAGFPCQDISVAGKGEGLDGKKSGLFYEVIRIAGIIKPRWLLLENVSALLTRGLDSVLRELAQIGYDSEWHCIPAAHVGAPHRRDRIYIMAHANSEGLQGQRGLEETSQICTQEAIRLFSSRVGQSQWGIEPDVDRMVNGVPRRVDRIKCLGNAVVPQVAQFMGEIILQRDQELFRKEEL
jgi:DNA (cytosine-5)-methyltransferase 1